MLNGAVDAPLFEGDGSQSVQCALAALRVKQDQVVKGVVIENKSGRQIYLAKVVIDCTGDGDVAFKETS